MWFVLSFFFIFFYSICLCYKYGFTESIPAFLKLSLGLYFTTFSFKCFHYMVLDFLLCHLVGFLFIIWFISWPILYSMFHYIYTVVVYILGENKD